MAGEIKNDERAAGTEGGNKKRLNPAGDPIKTERPVCVNSSGCERSDRGRVAALYIMHAAYVTRRYGSVSIKFKRPRADKKIKKKTRVRAAYKLLGVNEFVCVFFFLRVIPPCAYTC